MEIIMVLCYFSPASQINLKYTAIFDNVVHMTDYMSTVIASKAVV